MCDTCGCNVTPGNEHLVAAGGDLSRTSTGHESVEVLKGLLDANDHQAGHNREHFARHNALAVNLMSSPGAGKTALLEGDLETENDAERIRQKGVPAVQISTGSACHLDAHMVHNALHDLAIDEVDIVFIENVGNLVCPASFDLGQHLMRTGRGHRFRGAADLVLITKSDLLPVLDDFDPAVAEQYLRQLANPAPQLNLSARSGEGLGEWLDWLRARLSEVRAQDAAVGAG